jgi:N-acetylmuramate 1-kinase
MATPQRLIDALPALLKETDYDGPHTVTPLAGDASSRAYFRVQAGNRPYIAMLLPEGMKSSMAEEITKTSRPITELPFIDVQKYLEYRRVLVPTIYGYDEKAGVLLLEDFGNRLLYDVITKEKRKDVRELYETAIEQLERLCLIPDSIRPEKCIAFSRAFDRDLYNWEFLHFVEYALDRRLKNPPKGGDREKILKEMGRLTEEYLNWGNILSHRDYHSKNLLVIEPPYGKPKIAVIDFQDALLAPLFYDLASLLRDAYITLEPKMQDGLVENYRRRMMERNYNNTESKDAFRRAFDLMGIHRNLKAAGRFFYIDEVKKKPDYLQYIPRCLTYLEQDFEKYEELKPLKELMFPHFAELKSKCPS